MKLVEETPSDEARPYAELIWNFFISARTSKRVKCAKRLIEKLIDLFPNEIKYHIEALSLPLETDDSRVRQAVQLFFSKYGSLKVFRSKHYIVRLIDLALGNGLAEDVKSLLEEALEHSPDDADLLFLQGKYLVDSKQFDRAEVCLLKTDGGRFGKKSVQLLLSEIVKARTEG